MSSLHKVSCRALPITSAESRLWKIKGYNVQRQMDEGAIHYSKVLFVWGQRGSSPPVWPIYGQGFGDSDEQSSWRLCLWIVVTSAWQGKSLNPRSPPGTMKYGPDNCSLFCSLFSASAGSNRGWKCPKETIATSEGWQEYTKKEKKKQKVNCLRGFLFTVWLYFLFFYLFFF